MLGGVRAEKERKVELVCFCRARADILRWSMKCIRQSVGKRVAAEVWVTRRARVMRWPTSPQIHLCAASLRVAADSTLVDGSGGVCRAAEGRVCPRSPDYDPADMRRAERMEARRTVYLRNISNFEQKNEAIARRKHHFMLINLFHILGIRWGVIKYLKIASLTLGNRTHQRVLSW